MCFSFVSCCSGRAHVRALRDNVTEMDERVQTESSPARPRFRKRIGDLPADLPCANDATARSWAEGLFRPCECAGPRSRFSMLHAVNEVSVTVVSLAKLCIMGWEFTLAAERSNRPIRRLRLFATTNLFDGVLPHDWLCKAKRRLRFSFVLCLFCIFFNNKSMFHRLLASPARPSFYAPTMAAQFAGQPTT